VLTILTANDQDKAAARRFLGCYDDSVRLPSKECMERLIALGWIERVPGGYAETSALQTIDLF